MLQVENNIYHSSVVNWLISMMSQTQTMNICIFLCNVVLTHDMLQNQSSSYIRLTGSYSYLHYIHKGRFDLAGNDIALRVSIDIVLSIVKFELRCGLK